MVVTKWPWGVEESMILLNYGAVWLQGVWKFEFHWPVFEKVPSAGLNILQHIRLPKFNLIFHDSNKKCLFLKDQNRAKSRNLDDSAVISSDFPGLRTFATSMTSTASTASVASMTSTASIHQNITDTDGEIIPSTQMIKNSPFLWNGSSKI
jgi:hypothetical protein